MEDEYLSVDQVTSKIDEFLKSLRDQMAEDKKFFEENNIPANVGERLLRSNLLNPQDKQRLQQAMEQNEKDLELQVNASLSPKRRRSFKMPSGMAEV